MGKHEGDGGGIEWKHEDTLNGNGGKAFVQHEGN